MVASASLAAPRRKLPPLPADPLGAKFCEYFNHPWNFIWANVPESGEKTQWTTENRYPLQPRNLWEMYKDPNRILGLRFGRETRYALIDIDKDSSYHPDNNSENFRAVLGAAEKIGLCRNMFVRSSESGGLHIYFFLPESVPTFGLACAIKFALLDEGLQLGCGQLEIFPNVKAYSKNKPTNYNAHRLPLQVGSYLLNSDCQPVTNNISLLLDWADQDARHQDMEELKEAIAVAVPRQKATSYNRRSTSKAQEWKRHLESRIAQGWTGEGQTNDLLADIVCYGIVWKGLSSPALIDYVVETAINSPGYSEYCSHQHQIRQRAAEWVHSTLSNQFYTPYLSIPPRSSTYKETYGEVTNLGAANNVVPFRNAINEERSAKAMERVKEAIAYLEATNTLPTTATTRTLAIAQTTKALFDTTISRTTLYKPNYLPLWHPKYRELGCVLDQKQKVSGDSTESKKADDTVSDFLIETPQASSLEDSQKNPTPPPYMKVRDALSAPDAPQGHLGAADFNLDNLGEESVSVDVVKSLESAVVEDEAPALAAPTTEPTNVVKSLELAVVEDEASALVAPTTELTDKLMSSVVDLKRLIKIRLQATRKAQQEVQQQEVSARQLLTKHEREYKEVFVKMRLLWESDDPILRSEVIAWVEETDGVFLRDSGPVLMDEIASSPTSHQLFTSLERSADDLTDEEYYAQFLTTPTEKDVDELRQSLGFEEPLLGSPAETALNDFTPSGSNEDFELNDYEAEYLETPDPSWFTRPSIDETDESNNEFRF